MLVLTCILLVRQAFGQFLQDYQWGQGPQGPQRLWQYSYSSQLQPVIDVAPQAVVLEYNCFYLQEICVNVANFQDSFRGRSRPYPNVFGYDLSRVRKTSRRRQSCPTGKNGWAASHSCPETGPTRQSRPWRHDGIWPFAALDLLNHPSTRYAILDIRLLDPRWTSVVPSNMYYTCDEFPPATWVEGGSSITTAGSALNNGNAYTRCAAMRCRKGAKAEQNWQGSSHARLRDKLIEVARAAGYNPGATGVISFRLATRNEENHIPARVLTYSDQAEKNLTNTVEIQQAKRDVKDYLSWLNDVSVDDLIHTGGVTIQHILLNHTAQAEEDLRWLGSEDQDYDEDDLEAEEYGDQTTQVQSPRSLLPRNATNDLDEAISIIETALRDSAALNAQRYAMPRRQRYDSPQAPSNDTALPTPALLDLTDEIVDAAALLTESSIEKSALNVTKRQYSGSYWMGQIARKGTMPLGDDPNYKVFRNVKDYGAKGDGVTDDTKAIKQAMIDGKRCGEKCNGSTTKNGIVYFPPGKYLVSSTIAMPFGTQVIGDGKEWPTIIASELFVGLGVLSANEYTGGGKGIDGLDQQYFINTANFYRQVRNLRIDITRTSDSQQISALHWQVGQATSLQNLELIMKPGSKQKGIFTENGSGGVMSDITFRGGAFGIYGGDQQFTTQRLTFDGCTNAVQVIWDWGWIWKSVTVRNADVGFRLLQENRSSARKRQAANTATGNIGSVAFLDSSFTNVNTAVLIAPPSAQTGSGSTGLSIENVAFINAPKAVADTSGKVHLAGAAKIEDWVLGPTYLPNRAWSTGGSSAVYRRQRDLLDDQGRYLERAKPQYEDRPVADFIHVKDFGAKGDGSSDDTAAFQRALYASQGKILFVDSGAYMISNTLTVPAGTKLVGECWAQLIAYGFNFYDANNPRVMLKVGDKGEIGSVEMQDLIFTSRGPTIGLIVVQWNIQASSPGAAALWDCHIRIGGATGTQLTPKECPPLKDGTNSWCSAASLLMHITPTGSGLFDNMWLWVADHMIDDPDLNSANNTMDQVSVYVARGLLVESQQATWLYGTASEHCVLYQYNFNNARNIFAAILQTESPYYQPNPKPPAPFQGVIGKISGDPVYTCAANDEFSGCDQSWAVIIQRSANIMIGGAGLYSWFSTYTQECIASRSCQKALLLLKNNDAGIRFKNLITIGAKYMAVEDGKGITALDNLNVNSHPYWSQITAIEFKGSGKQVGTELWIDPKIWDMDTPSFTCSPPCVVQLPPWTKATSTVNYPLMTVSSGTWTSTITHPPITMSSVFFQKVTMTQGSGAKLHRRQDFQPFWPVPRPVPSFPPAVYVGPDGRLTTTAPAAAFPAGPASVGPNAVAPTGRFPARQVVPYTGADGPTVPACSFTDLDCIANTIISEMDSAGSLDPEDSDVDPDDILPCVTINLPEQPSSTRASSSSSTSTTSTKVALPRASPEQNQKHCLLEGHKMSNARMGNAINSFCNDIKQERGTLWNTKFLSEVKTYEPATIGLREAVRIQVEHFGNCEWNYTFDECVRYLRVGVDSCNCEGAEGKQGGEVRNNCLKWFIDADRIFP